MTKKNNKTFKRFLDIKALSGKKSLFLFGPRSTGKSTLLNEIFAKNSIINLLKSEFFLSLSGQPSLLREIVAKKMQLHRSPSNPIIIDEIQKIPALLDEVHYLIEEKKYKFILTGSSARKLKRSGVNLLAGRAWQANLFPLVSQEIPHFDLITYLTYGGLPQVYGSDDPIEELDAYVQTYLQEEIREEALVQNFANFSRFLKVAAMCNGEQLNYVKISSDTGVAVSTIKGYFEILQDTFTVFLLLPWQKSQKRKSVATAKFYFFDIGVANFLKSITKIEKNTTEFGKAFEHFMAMELRAYISYKRLKISLTYWKSQTHDEVDFIIGDEIAIEIKTANKVNPKFLNSLKKLQEEKIIKKFYLISFDKIERLTPEGIHLSYWEHFIADMWNGLII